MYQAAEEGEGGPDVGKGGGVEGRPNGQNSTETPLNPSKCVFSLSTIWMQYFYVTVSLSNPTIPQYACPTNTTTPIVLSKVSVSW